MTKPYENMKTEKRRAKQGERIIVTKPYENAEYNEGRIFTVEESIPQCDVYFEHVIVKEFDRAKLLSDEYEVIISDSDIEALHKEIEILRNERDDARKKLKTLTDGISDYRTRIERQEAAIQSLQEKEKEAEEKIEHLEHRSAELDAYNDGWKEQNQVLRNKNLNLSIRMRELREDHAAAEDRYQQEIKRLNGIIDTIQSYVRGLEVGVK